MDFYSKTVNQLIEELEESLKQKVEEEELFWIEWEMV